MLNIGGLTEGIVLDHIHAGGAMEIYNYLNLEKLDCSVAIIKNAKSSKMGKKDIIKIEQHIDIDFDMLAVLEPHMTINYIKNGERVEKRQLNLPEHIYGIIKCKNPRCITSIEQELPHRFKLTNREKAIYRCEYCEQSFKQSRKKK
ncbi:MAG: aspartate carbamoyltransferase regulatory subunit [Lachnospiraceae bacterium]|nr:aspartate carbamoyltransferase regulatory subunit [Lachnospiraceae bacterium]MBP3609893.1 aspartate carbamoyltransferase regulatory subunit [Lachnospiraceae bacterium]